MALFSRRELASSLGATLLGRLCAAREDRRIEIWYGGEQRVGALGTPQPDFNLLGHLIGPERLASLTYSLNDGPPVELSYRAFRRLAVDGDFNADIPTADLRLGLNLVTLRARWSDGQEASRRVRVIREARRRPAPLAVRWSAVAQLADAGRPVDGLWTLTSKGIRSVRPGYDRLFLIGDSEWQDYEVRTTILVHRIDFETGPNSGHPGLGLIFRFAGHVVGGHRNFPAAQPKWGYQPCGAITWMRWRKGRPEIPSRAQFYRGDNDDRSNYGVFAITPETAYSIRADCRTLSPAKNKAGVTRYRFKVWPSGESEPEQWNMAAKQVSRHALRRGGVALLAHHVDATFGDVDVRLHSRATD